jgi:hypothetical protein
VIAGRYSLDSEIGRGGMGVVWRGEDQVLGRDVALKRIGLAPGGASQNLLRAEREAKLAASLNHPNVVAVFDLVVEDDEHWLVMEHVPSRNLSALARQHRIDPDEAGQILGQAADGLAAAHGAGIVHRDVKPSNILVTADGQVKLTDFGIARASQDATLTQTGMVTGSPAYMAPEVASGKPASPASDVWSLGATLYHALAGKPPYDVKDNVVAALYRIVHEDPPRLSNAGWLAPVLEGTMATDPDQRWSMAQVRDYLLAGPGAPVPVPDATATLPRRLADTITTRLPGAAAAGASATRSQPGDTAETPQTPAAPETTATPAAAAPPPPVEPEPRPDRRRKVTAWLVGAAALLLAALVLTVALRSDDGSDTASDPPTASDAPDAPASSQEEPTQEEPTEPTEGDAPSAEAMEGFVEDYVATAPQDRDATWTRLTPQFQQASGGRAGYERWWSQWDGARVLESSADPDAMTVTYVIEYERDGSTETDEVTLTLVQAGDSFKIADEL